MGKQKIDITYWPVRSNDLDELKSFLKANTLPFDDIILDGNWFAIYRRQSGAIVGTGGLEFYGDHCLLRSIATAKEFRGKGLGKEIVQDLISKANDRSARTISLLTESAQGFFEKIGFKELSRDSAPKEIKASSEFVSVCPVSAVFMSIDLTNKAVV